MAKTLQLPVNLTVEIDETLTKPGIPADSKVVGDNITELKKRGSVLVSEEAPTTEDVQLWIDESESEEFSVPEIKDNEENSSDTWSSSKIAGEISELKSDLIRLDGYIFEDSVSLKGSVSNYTKSQGWELVGDGTRKANANSEIIGYTVTEGQLLHIKLNKYTDCVYHFATAYSFGTNKIVGYAVSHSVDSIVVVPTGATRLMISQKLDDTDNKIYTANVLLDLEKNRVNDITELFRYDAVLKYEKGNNRFDSSREHYLDGYYVLNGEFVEKSGFFVTHLMEVEPNTTYHKNESAHGILYDKNINIIGLTTGNEFTTPDNCRYYRTSATDSIASKLYVSPIDAISSFVDEPTLTNDAEKAVKKVISATADIKTEIQSVASKYVNTNQARNKAVVTFIDDDGRAEVYTRLLPIIRTKNIKYGLAIVSQYIDGSDSCMTLEQLKECHDTGLIETLSHTYTMNSSLLDLTEEELEYQFSMSKQWLDDNGFENHGLVYTTNNSNGLVRHVARQYYDYCFTGTNFNDKGYLDHSLIDRIAFGSFTYSNPIIDGVSDNGSLEYYKACVDKAVTNGEWIIFMTHIADQTEETDSVLESLIDYIQEKNVDILFPSEGFALKRNQVNIGDSSDKYLFIGNKNYSTNIIGYQYRLRSEITGNGVASQPVTVFPPNAVTITYFNASANGGYPTTAGTLETFYCKTSPDFSWQRWTAYPTCKQQMRFWDNTNKVWLDWVALN